MNVNEYAKYSRMERGIETRMHIKYEFCTVSEKI